MEPCMYNEGFGLIQCPTARAMEPYMYSEGFGLIQCPSKTIQD